MKKILSISSLFAFFLVITSCVNSQNVISGIGAAVLQNRSVSGFTSVSLDVPGDLYLTQGDFSCSVTAQQNIQDILITEVKNNELVIRFKDRINVRDYRDLKINVSLPNLHGLALNGSGNAYAQSNFSSDKMKLEVNGSGNVSFRLR
jgi:hypothetical protein